MAADVNGDGLIDLISANYANNTLSVLTNDGAGGFGLALSPDVGGGSQSVSAADVNGDGMVDLISANQFGNSLSVLQNAAPFPPATIPVITIQSAVQTNQAGAAATFNVGFRATGPQLFSYQWRLEETNLLAATNNTLILPNLTRGCVKTRTCFEQLLCLPVCDKYEPSDWSGPLANAAFS